jgi:hypothetical protein
LRPEKHCPTLWCPSFVFGIFTRTLNLLWHYGSGRDAHGVCAVSSAKEFRDNAEECIGWARTAHSDKEREIFLQIARTWIEAAERLEVLAPPPLGTYKSESGEVGRLSWRPTPPNDAKYHSDGISLSFHY